MASPSNTSHVPAATVPYQAAPGRYSTAWLLTVLDLSFTHEIATLSWVLLATDMMFIKLCCARQKPLQAASVSLLICVAFDQPSMLLGSKAHGNHVLALST